MKEFTRALLVFLVMTMLTGLAYPFGITQLCQLLFPEQASGSLVTSGDSVIGSALVGQKFTRPGYFHGRPAANDYDAGNSGGSNFGPSNAKYLEEVGQRVTQVRRENGLDVGAPVPPDLVLASASGLDPHISLDGALIQVPRVARARALPEARVRTLVEKLTEPPFLGLTGQDRINVLKLNLALDALTPERR
jgi:potassium-transporting ATPase KdpC subunit